MCKFIRIAYQCGHGKLLTTPSGTALCSTARMFACRQGIDMAPPSCFPLPARDVDDEDIIFLHNWDLGYCGDCRVRRGLLGLTGGADESTESEYSDEHWDQLSAYEVQLEEELEHGMLICEDFERNAYMRGRVPYLEHEWLRQVLRPDGPEKYGYLFLKDFPECLQWLPHLRTYITQNVPVETYRRVLEFFLEKSNNALEKLGIFRTIVDLLVDFEPETGFYQEIISHNADQLQELVQGKPDGVPEGFEYLKKGFRMPPGFRRPRPRSLPSRGYEFSHFSVPDSPTDSLVSEHSEVEERKEGVYELSHFRVPTSPTGSTVSGSSQTDQNVFIPSSLPLHRRKERPAPILILPPPPCENLPDAEHIPIPDVPAEQVVETGSLEPLESEQSHIRSARMQAVPLAPARMAPPSPQPPITVSIFPCLPC